MGGPLEQNFATKGGLTAFRTFGDGAASYGGCDNKINSNIKGTIYRLGLVNRPFIIDNILECTTHKKLLNTMIFSSSIVKHADFFMRGKIFGRALISVVLSRRFDRLIAKRKFVCLRFGRRRMPFVVARRFAVTLGICGQAEGPL